MCARRVRGKPGGKHFFAEGNQVYNGSHADSIGKRVTMEDAGAAIGELLGPKTQYYGLFDGHGGNEVSVYLAQNLHKKIAEIYENNKDIPEVLKQAFIDINKYLTETYKAIGSTGTVVIIKDNFLYTANVGDTRAILIDKEGKEKRLTKDHRLNDPEERELIEKRGGAIFNDRVDGIVAVTRAFGDGNVAQSITSEPYISVEPFEIGNKLAIVCDGVTDVMSDGVIAEVFLKNPELGIAVKAIRDEAINRLSTDNISVICVDLTPK